MSVISGSLASLSSSLATTTSAGVGLRSQASKIAPSVPKPQAPAADFADLVRPTEAQQVQQLYRQGRTVPQIASTLELSAQAVDGYLNISNFKG